MSIRLIASCSWPFSLRGLAVSHCRMVDSAEWVTVHYGYRGRQMVQAGYTGWQTLQNGYKGWQTVLNGYKGWQTVCNGTKLL